MRVRGAAFTLSRLRTAAFRMSPYPFFRLVLVGAVSLLAGCDQAPPAPAVATPATTSAAVQESAANDDVGQGNGYTYHVRYPQLAPEWSTLADALHAYAAARKKDFLDARLADENTDGPPYNLDLEFNIARRTSDFVSLFANGSAATGGAHPTPLVASFNLHTGDGRLINLADLFADGSVALNTLSEEARRQLEGRYEAKLRETTPEKDQAAALKSMREWVEEGTEAKPENFAVFLVDGLETKAIGLTLIFPSYQVAAYADGTQQVEVPAKVFYNLLKPEYRDAFQIDTEAARIAPGVR
jgi:hypothetical protein